MREGRTPPSPLPPLRPRKRHVSPDDEIRYWNETLLDVIVNKVCFGLILLLLAFLAWLTTTIFKDNHEIRESILVILVVLGVFPALIVAYNALLLILFGPGHYFHWRMFKQKHDWELMNKFHRSKEFRRLLQEEAIREKAERLMEEGTPYHIGKDGEIVFDERPKHHK